MNKPMKLLSTAIGDFWMSADKIVLPFKAVDVTDIVNKRYTYSVDQSIILIPELPEYFSYSELALESNIKLYQHHKNDWCTDEFYSGTLWEINDKILGVANYVDNGQLDEHEKPSDLGFPSYFDIDDRYRGQLLFQVTYKSLDGYQLLDKQGIDDLSIDFSFEEMSLWINSRK